MSEREIRFLVEGYYDVQKMRVEAFNRIVAYVKSQMENASHQASETQDVSASQKMVETHGIDASQIRFETQVALASHLLLENHFGYASQITFETQGVNASHETSETQKTFASHHALETQESDASHSMTENHEQCAGGEGKYATIARLMLKHPPHEISELVWFHNTLYETEKQLAKRIDKWSRNHPLRINYLNHVQGIGPILASGLIAWLSPISRFATISRLWKYCGLAPNQKRKHGEKLDYNPKLKTFMWKIGSSFIKQKPEKCVYRHLYETKKAELEKRPDLAEALRNKQSGAKLHIHLLALRFTVKRFLADLWIEWRKMEGLPISEPYAIAVLKHPKEAV